MKDLLRELRSALVATLTLAVVCSGVYPLAVFAIAQLGFPEQANGSLMIDEEGDVRGSILLGQPFMGVNYFHPRPSAAGNGYDGVSSGGSNLGPTSQKLCDAIRDRIEVYRKENELNPGDSVPADAVTASGSGLDPHISRRNAEYQIARVAKARGLSEGEVRELVHQKTDAASLGVLGEPGVNVLRLNFALDHLSGEAAVRKLPR